MGHFAVAFAAKRVAPRASLAVLILAAQLADVIWPVLVAAGVEEVRIDPGNTAFTPLDFVAYPYSHSLVLLVVWGLILGLVSRTHVGGRAAVPLIAGLVVSHWVLDWVTHRPDMPLFLGGPRLGLGLWNSVRWTLVIELAAGTWIYARTTRALDPVGRWGFVTLVAVLVAGYLANLRSVPPSVVALYTTSIAGAALIAAWARLVGEYVAACASNRRVTFVKTVLLDKVTEYAKRLELVVVVSGAKSRPGRRVFPGATWQLPSDKTARPRRIATALRSIRLLRRDDLGE